MNGVEWIDENSISNGLKQFDGFEKLSFVAKTLSLLFSYPRNML